jgi:hypothetical protein
MATRADGVRVAYPLFQAEGGGSTPTSALALRLYRIDFRLAKQLVRLWHSRLPRLTSPQCRAAYGAESGGLYYAVAVWCRPIASSLPQYEWMELQRLAVAPDAPRNTASRLLAVMARLIHNDYPEITRLISYQDTEVHTGGIYKAAGWTPTVCNKFSEWDRPSRPRAQVQSIAPKQRWEKVLHGNPVD